MSSLVAMPTRQFSFLKAEKPDNSQPRPPQHTKQDERHHNSRKKRLLFAIKRDLQAASTLPRDTSAESLKLVEKLEAVRSLASANHRNLASSAASQLSQSMALIERFIVDQLPQGSVGDNILAAWNCILERSVRAVPLTRHSRPRVVEQLRCKAETAYTSSGTSLMIFRADNSSDEQLRISRIEEMLTQGDCRACSQMQTPHMKEPSPRARFLQHVSHKALPRVPASIAVKTLGGVAAAEKESTDWGEAASNSGHFEKLVQILGCGDQRVQSRELNKELDNIRENLKQMKGRVHLMTERLDVQETSETPLLPLEPHERHFLQVLMDAMPATGLRDVTGVEKLLQLQSEELQRVQLNANERLTAMQAHAHVQQQQIRAQLENENRKEVEEIQKQLQDCRCEVLDLQQLLKKQREYCGNHHIYDTTSPLMTADTIIQSPASVADEAAIGLLDMAQQIQRGIYGMKLCAAMSEAAGSQRKQEQESLQQLLIFVQNLLQQLAAGAHDLSTCIQRAAQMKRHPGIKNI